MKVTSVESFVLAVPTPRPMALEFPEHRLVVARLATDEGPTGLGYSLAFGGGGAESIQVYLGTRLKPLVLGQDPLFVERVWERSARWDERTDATLTSMEPGDVKAYLERGWAAAEALKRAYWASEFARRGPDATIQAAHALWRHMRLLRPDWPSEDQRRADFAHHVPILGLRLHRLRTPFHVHRDIAHSTPPHEIP